MADDGSDEGEWAENSDRVRYYRFRNKLKEKAGGGARQNGFVDDEALKRAESTFAKASAQYPKLVESSISTLADACTETLSKPASQRDAEFKRINTLAHDLKGQGGTFGYPLITTFADSLFKFTGAGARQTDNYVEIVKAHIDAIRAVVTGKIEGDGGDIGRELRLVLEAAIKKYAPQQPTNSQ